LDSEQHQIAAMPESVGIPEIVHGPPMSSDQGSPAAFFSSTAPRSHLKEAQFLGNSGQFVDVCIHICILNPFFYHIHSVCKAMNLRGQKVLPHSLIKKEFRGLTNRD
jgi:hypothetical protein